MKKLSLTLLAGLLLVTSLPAAADSYRHDRGWHRPPPAARHHPPPRHFDNRLAWGVGALALGGVLWSIQASQPQMVPVAPAYVAPPVAPPRGVWYYCDAYGAYYPNVGQCPGGWRAVPAY